MEKICYKVYLHDTGFIVVVAAVRLGDKARRGWSGSETRRIPPEGLSIGTVSADGEIDNTLVRENGLKLHSIHLGTKTLTLKKRKWRSRVRCGLVTRWSTGLTMHCAFL